MSTVRGRSESLFLKRLGDFRDSSAAGKIRKRMPGAGRPLSYKQLDDELSEWVKEQRRKKLKVSRRLISLEAEKRFNADADDYGFKVSSPRLFLSPSP